MPLSLVRGCKAIFFLPPHSERISGGKKIPDSILISRISQKSLPTPTPLPPLRRVNVLDFSSGASAFSLKLVTSLQGTAERRDQRKKLLLSLSAPSSYLSGGWGLEEDVV
jgi:hypothetical protein